MRDAHLGRAFLFLEVLPEYTLPSIKFMVICSSNEVGDVLCQVSSGLKPLLHASLLANAEILYIELLKSYSTLGLPHQLPITWEVAGVFLAVVLATPD